MSFQFKQFHIEDDLSSMKVGTDAVLLGAWTDPKDAKTILDIGCGSGLIALMMAQKSTAKVVGIEIDEASSKQAQENIVNSPWEDQVNIMNCSFQDFFKSEHTTFDLILSNPPFYNNALLSPIERKKNAKHTVLLNFEELLYGTKKLLSENGQANFVIPYSELEYFNQTANQEGLKMNRILHILPKASKDINRVLVKLQHQATDLIEEQLIIRNEDNSYTSAYQKLTQAYYLNF